LHPNIGKPRILRWLKRGNRIVDPFRTLREAIRANSTHQPSRG